MYFDDLILTWIMVVLDPATLGRNLPLDLSIDMSRFDTSTPQPMI